MIEAELHKYNMNKMEFIGKEKIKMETTDPEKHLNTTKHGMKKINPQAHPKDIPDDIKYEKIYRGVPDFYNIYEEKFIEVKTENDGLRESQIEWMCKENENIELYIFKNLKEDIITCDSCNKAFNTHKKLKIHRIQKH